MLHTLMFVYISMVLYVTVMPINIPLGATNKYFLDQANFIPFRDLRLGYSGAEREIVLNIIMMVPFGFLFPIIQNKGMIFTVLMTFIFSLMIESTQLLMVYLGSLYSRSFDVTDLITNTLGGFVGFLLYIPFSRLFRKIIDS